MDGKEYCIYLRKSRADMDAEAHGEGETLARHEKALLELAKRERPAPSCSSFYRRYRPDNGPGCW